MQVCRQDQHGAWLAVYLQIGQRGSRQAGRAPPEEGRGWNADHHGSDPYGTAVSRTERTGKGVAHDKQSFASITQLQQQAKTVQCKSLAIVDLTCFNFKFTYPLWSTMESCLREEV